MLNNLKLLFLVTEDWYFCSHRMNVARAAKQAGYEVSVLTRINEHGDAIRDEGFNLIPLDIERGGINPLRELKTLINIWRVYRRNKPDLVHHVALKPVLYGGIVSLFNSDIKVVGLVAGLGGIFSSNRWKARLLHTPVKVLLRLLFRRPCSRVVVQNSEDMAMLINELGINPDAIVLIKGSGVNTKQFTDKPEPEGMVSVALVSRLLWDKGIAEFIDAVRLLKQRGLEFSALLVGNPDDENMASVSQSQLNEWQASGLVECLGYVEDISQFWKNSHIAVLPSYREGLPKSLLEAAASGRPIVTTDTSGCREIVNDGINGFLVPVRDTVKLADAMEKLILDAKLRKQMGKAGRKMVAQEFSDEKVIAETLQVYQDLL